MDKIRQAIERARAERQPHSQGQGSASAPAHGFTQTTAAVPFEPELQALEAANVLPMTDSGSAARAVRLLRTIVVQRMRERNWRVLGVVSARGTDGKSVLAANLAVAIAADPRYTGILVDLDVSEPWVAAAFGTPPSEGLVACLLGEQNLAETIFAPVGMGRLELIPLCPAGGTVESSVVALPTLAAVKEALIAREETIVVVNLPAVLDSDAALTAATLCDCLLFGVREGMTTRADLERALGLLSAVPVLGTVLVDSVASPTEGPAEA